MSDIDYERINHLLNIVAQCAGHSGKLSSISNAAMTDLLEADASLKEHAINKRVEAEKAEAQKAKVIERPAPIGNEAEVEDLQDQIHETGDGSADDLPKPKRRV